MLPEAGSNSMPLTFTVLDGPQQGSELRQETGLETCLVRQSSGHLTLLNPAEELPAGTLVCLNLLFWEGSWYAATTLPGTRIGGRVPNTLKPLLPGSRLCFPSLGPVTLQVAEASATQMVLDLGNLELRPEDLLGTVRSVSGTTGLGKILPARFGWQLRLLGAVVTGVAVLAVGVAVVRAPTLLGNRPPVSTLDPLALVDKTGASDPEVLAVAQDLQERLLQIPEESALDVPSTLATLAGIRRQGQLLSRIHPGSPLAVGVATATTAVYEVSRGAATGDVQALNAAAQSARRSLDVWQRLPVAEQAVDPALFYRSLARLSLLESERLCAEFTQGQSGGAANPGPSPDATLGPPVPGTVPLTQNGGDLSAKCS